MNYSAVLTNPLLVRSFRDLIEVRPSDPQGRTRAVFPMRTSFHGHRHADPRTLNNVRLVLAAWHIRTVLASLAKENDYNEFTQSMALLHRVLNGDLSVPPDESYVSPGLWTWDMNSRIEGLDECIAGVGDSSPDMPVPMRPTDIAFVRLVASAPSCRQIAQQVIALANGSHAITRNYVQAALQHHDMT